ncbi:MAG TPA: ABC transporter substrate-binding protein [Firmicutes bacterium]|jgi:ABC-type nitrate/sulfonate/bicarbonate transport system substrate-binding protein|nr:ABC transporter substrate-binding protein [Bacillota bacterium]
MRKYRLLTVVLMLVLTALPLVACRQPNTNEGLRPITVVLDWTPNTNHTGLYVAQAEGYFEEQGLDVTIMLPGDAGVIQTVASGNAHFGVSYQEELTLARVQRVPALSIAAVIQHNTSGFASPVAKNIKSPKDFVGKTYGGWGSPVEEAVIESVMQLEGVSARDVNFINIGDVDFFTAVQRDIDFAWAFYAWTGIEAELRNFPLNMIYVKDLSPQLDYYTPILITSEQLAADDPELVKAFMAAVTQGYEFAMANPEAAAEILLAAEPDLDPDLVRASQAWLADKYQDDAPRWGQQKLEVWEGYTEWMLSKGLLEKEIDVKQAFTNDFLPDR